MKTMLKMFVFKLICCCLLDNYPISDVFFYDISFFNFRLQRYYSKKGGRWTATEVKTPKQYMYIPELMKHIIMKRLSDNIGMSRRVILDPLDPRRLSATIAPVPPPPTQDLMAAKISRFNREDLDRTIDYDHDQTIDYEWPTN